MTTGNPDLIRFIRAEIEKRGPQSFAWFMQQALYHIDCGYYSSGHCEIGRKGDYFTNVSVGPLFGQLLAAQFIQIWERLGKPGRDRGTDPFMIVEQGAHDGQFARDVLEYAQKRAPEFFEALRYQIVEPFPILRERQSQTLTSFRDKVEWHDSLRPFTGIHFSNELLDAMPVRLIANGREKLVGLDDDQLVFVEREVSDQKFNDAALAWVDQIAANLKRGYVIAVDYGHSKDEFRGNVQVRARHRNLDSPFEQIGNADITMHVDWMSIAERARENGLRLTGFTDQHHFLTGIISKFADDDLDQSLPGDSVSAKRELQTLLHPETLGRAFQVLMLEKKSDPGATPLACFRFAREPRLTRRVNEPDQ